MKGHLSKRNYALNATVTTLAINNTHTLYCETIQLISFSEQQKMGEKMGTSRQDDSNTGNENEGQKTEEDLFYRLAFRNT